MDLKSEIPRQPGLFLDGSLRFAEPLSMPAFPEHRLPAWVAFVREQTLRREMVSATGA